MSRPLLPNRVKEIIIHCSATPNGRWHIAEDVDRWHSERGFKRDPRLIGHNAQHMPHIGYHFVIPTSGSAQSCRGLGEAGAHARGHNHKSIAICLIGTDQYTKEQWHALRIIVTGMKSRFKSAQVFGHNQINKGKTCPGFDVKAWLAGNMAAPDGHLLSEDETQ